MCNKLNISDIKKGGGKRETPLELLRILAILMVMSLHLMVGHNSFEVCKTIYGGYVTTTMLLILCTTSVDIFLIISGYFSVYSQKRKLGKPITLILLVVFYKALDYIVNSIICHSFSISGFLYALLPINYFVNIFCVLYVISPFINKTLLSISRNNLNRLLITLLVCFSLWPMFANIILKHFWGTDIIGVYPVAWSGTDGGYTIVNFSVCYIIGAYIRITNFKLWSKQMYRMGFICSLILLSTVLILWHPQLNGICAKPMPVGGVCSYDSIITIILASSLFMMFRQMPPFHIGFVNILASATFGVFLIHNKVFSKMAIYIPSLFSADGASVEYWAKFAGIVLFAYILSVMVYMCCNFIATPVRNIWKKSPLYNMTSYDIEM